MTDFEPTSISNETFSAAIVEAQGYNQWLINFYKEFIKGEILEIGVGHGCFVDYMPSTVTSYTGFDIDPNLIAWAKNRNPQACYIEGDLSSSNFQDVINNKTFDCILCINVLEHIEDHQKALQNMLRALNVKGKILLFVPAFMNLYQDMDKLAGHYRRYRIGDVQKLCEASGGEISKWAYFNPIGGIGWWVNKFRSHTNLNDPHINKQIRFFEKYILPFSKAFQPLCSKFFGQSLYCVIQRKDS